MGDGVVVVHHRTVAGTSGGAQPQPVHPLLGRLDQVEAGAVVQRDAEAAHLTDRLGAVGEQLGVMIDQVVRPFAAAGLLVGQEGQHDVAGRPLAAAGPLADERERHRIHVLHIHRATTPHVAVAHLAGERVDRPLAALGRHDVEVAVDEQRRPAAVGTFDARDRRCTPRRGLDDLRLDADLVQLGRDPLGGRPFGVRRVGRVDADQLDEQIGDLVLG